MNVAVLSRLPNEPTQTEGPLVTLVQYLRFLRAHWVLALVVFILIFSLGLGWSLLSPKRYQAVATVLVDPRAPDPVYGYSVPTFLPGGANATQVEIITSERVRLRVVQMLGLAKNPEARAAWQDDGAKGSIEQYWADRIGRFLEAKPSAQGSTISVEYSAADPNFAAELANAFAHAYVETSAELRADPARASAEFFDTHARQLREAVEKAQSNLSAYQQEHGITVTDERLDIENERLTQLSTQLTAIQVQRSESSSRSRQAQGETANSPDVMENSLVQTLSEAHAQAERKLHELSKNLGSNHPQYQAAQAEVDLLKAQLNEAMRRAAGSLGTTNAVNMQREAELREAVEAQKKKLLQLRLQRDEVAVLQKDVEDAQKAYDLAKQRLAQTNLESQSQQTSVTVLSEALPPTEPSQPKIMRNVLLSTLIGFALGMVAAVVAESLDRRVRGIDDVTQLYGLPVLVTLPSDGTVRRALRSSGPVPQTNGV